MAETGTGRIVWHELSTGDVGRAGAFYTELLGWELEVWKPGEVDYPMIRAGGQVHGGFAALDPARAAPAHWLAYVRVNDVDATAARAARLGGSVPVGPADIPDVGRFAVIADPQRAAIAAFASVGEEETGRGTFVWDELLTTDVDGAKRFYGELFGWAAEDVMDGRYTVFRSGGETVAGLMRKPEDAPACAWLTYLATADLDATLRRAVALGGAQAAPPMEVAGVGRFAVIVDPTGAAFGVLQPE